MHLPENTKDWILAGLALVIIIGAIIIQTIDHDLPQWLLTAIAAVITYYFGLASSSKKP
jgi:uncharacterized membrane protein AbrB (regulator of aidB expression)